MAARGESLVLIDGHALLHRAWHALPPLTTKRGQVVNAVYGFLLVFFKVLKELKPTHVAVTFDVAGPTFRHEAYEGYKATREKQPDELYAQIPLLKGVLEAFGITVVEKEGVEADDVIGTLSAVAAAAKLPTTIVTGDLDTLQLVDDNTRVMTLRKGLSDTIFYDPAAVVARYGLPPSAMVDYRALKGDPSDNIPGVKGIGEKTAATLIAHFHTFDDLVRAAKGPDPAVAPLTERLRSMILEHLEDAVMSRSLSVIHRDVPLPVTLAELRRRAYDTDTLVRLFQEYEFKSLLPKLTELETLPTDTPPLAAPSATAVPDATRYEIVRTDKEFTSFLETLRAQPAVAMRTLASDHRPFTATLLALGFCWEPGVAYAVLLDGKPKRLIALRSALEDASISKWGHDMKFDMEVLMMHGVSLAGVVGDTMLASYLLNPGSRAHDIETISFTECGHRMTTLAQLLGEKKEEKRLEEVSPHARAAFVCEQADYVWRLSDTFSKGLADAQLDKLFATIEVPLIHVLARMERQGISVDRRRLAASARAVGIRIAALEKKIHRLAGEPFNIASPLQLKRILFERLNISSQGIGKTKTGLSTAAAELEKLVDEHPIVPLLLEYRELAKLKSTYLDALPLLIEKRSKRIHTSFNQTIAATGRLSSSDPNLQNIPIRTELGNEVRKAFVAKRGMTLLSADYSQIELRIVASLANDRAMIEIFEHGEDIHRATAAKIHGIPEAEVTKAIRSTAKEVNFGVIYGMGSWGLSSRTSLSQSEARAFIEKYFATFAGVKAYLDATKEVAKKQGYVETLFGRRRYLPEIQSGMANVRAGAERMAINMPIQGTAADIMKLAMIAIDARLSSVEPRARMLLQVHDELIFEVPTKSVAVVARFVKEVMEGVVTLKVPIEVHLSAGRSWGELQSFEL